MGAKENLAIIVAMEQAAQHGDFEHWVSYIADDAVWRAAGVPSSMGGVVTGKQSIMELATANAEDSLEVKDRFADDEHVCVIGKLNAEWRGNEYLRGAEKPFSTYQCTVYRIVNGKVTESTSYVNWLDAYVQVGLVDPSSFLR
jgi:ketosteroid isomerase-like protein